MIKTLQRRFAVAQSPIMEFVRSARSFFPKKDNGILRSCSLGTALFVVSSTLILKFGIATVVLVGSVLLIHALSSIYPCRQL